MSTAESRPAVPIAPDGWTPKAGPDPVLRAKHGLIGAQVSRLDGPLKVRGEARFAAEYVMEGMVYAALRYSTIARGRITTLDTSAAEAAAGVVLVMTHRNAPRMQPPPLFLTAPKAAGGSDLPVMQDDSIHWNGEPVAVVLAETQEQADHAASLIEVAYESSTPRTFEEARAHPRTPDSLVGQPVEVLVGDAEAALADAPHSVDLTYRTPRHNHNAIEPHAVTLAWDGDDLIVHDASQGVKLHAWTFAQVFEIDESQVHLTSPYVGGGFGGKTLWSHHLLGAAASKLAGRPVRVTLSREGVYRLVGGRTNTEQRVAIGADDDGRFTALIHTGISAMTAAQRARRAVHVPRAAHVRDRDPEDRPAGRRHGHARQLVHARARGVGRHLRAGVGDRRARDRARSGPDRAADPQRAREGPELGPAVLRPSPRRRVARGRRALRLGAASRAGHAPGGRMADRHGLRERDLPLPSLSRRRRADQARQDGPRDGRGAGQRHGDGDLDDPDDHHRRAARLPLERVTVAHGDSSFPGSLIAGGSSQTASIGGAVIAAQRALVEQLLALAGDESPLAGLTADEVGGATRGCASSPTRAAGRATRRSSNARAATS